MIVCRAVRTALSIAFLFLANCALAQSNFDPLVADQIRHLKEQQGQLQQQNEAIARQLGLPPTPPPTNAGKVWTNSRTGATRVDRLSADYEKNRAAALAKYQADLERFNAAQELHRQHQIAQQIEQRGTVVQSPAPAQNDPSLASRIRAAERYPQLGDPNCVFTKKYLEIAKRLAEARSPIVNQPDAAERVADMTAAELKAEPAK